MTASSRSRSITSSRATPISVGEAPRKLTAHVMSDAGALFEQGFGRHQQGDLAGAAELLSARHPARPGQHADVLHMLGIAAFQLGDGAAAVEILGRALELRTLFPEARGNLATMLQSLGRLAEAEDAAARAIAEAPQGDRPPRSTSISATCCPTRAGSQEAVARIPRRPCACSREYPEAYSAISARPCATWTISTARSRPMPSAVAKNRITPKRAIISPTPIAIIGQSAPGRGTELRALRAAPWIMSRRTTAWAWCWATRDGRTMRSMPSRAPWRGIPRIFRRRATGSARSSMSRA